MELTPQQFIEAEFSEVRRGFDRDEVDAFLVKAAKGVEAMQKRIAELEAELAHPRPESPSDETIGRTLKLAQRTADDLVAEARREADALITEAGREAEDARGDATREASRTLDDAHVRAAQVLAEAEAEARAASEELRTRLRSEVAALEEARNRLRSEITLLEQHLAARRDSLIEAADNLRVLAGETLSGEPVPELAPLELPDETPVLQFNERSHEEPAADPPDLDTVPDIAPDLADDSSPVALPPPAPIDEHADDEEPEIPILDDGDPTPPGGISRDHASTAPPADTPSTFFDDTETFRDERWKPRRERNR
ncbi:MAG: DivIVA domain-containing protein [Acidimicrobiales bacterium]